jgi:hypothetical protein
MFSNVAVTSAGIDGIALGAASGATFTKLAIHDAGHDGLRINGAATGAIYTNVAITLTSSSHDGIEVTGDGSNSSYNAVSVLTPGMDGLAIGTSTMSNFANVTVIGAVHDGVVIAGDASSSIFNSLVMVLQNGGGTGLAVAGALSSGTVSSVTVSGIGGSPPKFTGGISVASDAMGTTFSSNTVFGGYKFGILVGGLTTSSQFSKNVIQELGQTASGSVGITAAGNSFEVSNNVITGPFQDGLVLVAAPGAVSAVELNVINTGGPGVGVLLQAETGVQVAGGCNNVSGNAVGFKVVGDGTSAGTIDLGGGPLGSATVMTGENMFDQTNTANTLAISLTQTDASGMVSALGNVFADLNAIQDATHNGGTGTIEVSQGTSTCPGTVAIVMGGFNVAEGTPYNGPVAFYTVFPPVPAGPFSATITWGDGGMSPGTISQPGGAGTPFIVSGTHTYTTAGIYATSVTVLDGQTSYVAPSPGTALVTDPAPVITVPPLMATAGVATGTVAVATFTDPGTPLPPSQYTATIDWGDKTPPILGVITASGTTYTVSGVHTYAQAGKFTITVAVSDMGNPPAVATGPATVVTTTTTTLAPPMPNPSDAGQAVTFVATVAPGAGSTPPPAGELVTFLDGTNPLGTAPLDGSGRATFMTAALTPGLHSIGASYPGDATFGPSMASPVTQMVLSTPVTPVTTTQLLSSANPAAPGQAVTFTAIVTPVAGSVAGTPTGTVTFTIDGVPQQPPVMLAVVGGKAQATFTAANLAAGTHTIIAAYSGDSTFMASMSLPLGQVIGTSQLPPAVVALERFGFHAQPTSLVVIFSGALDPARAQNVNEYKVVLLVKSRHGRFQPGPTIAVAQAIYNPTNLTVTLLMSKRLSLRNLYQITINGTPPNGLTSPSGQFLDGAGNGQGGTNYVKAFGPGILAGPAPSTPPQVQTLAARKR